MTVRRWQHLLSLLLRASSLSISRRVTIITVSAVKKSQIVEKVDLRASLLKAMIIHSGMPMKGHCNKDFECEEFTTNHQFYEGHGRMQLDQVLRFDDSPFELFLYYGQVNDRKHSFTIQVPLKISFPSTSSDFLYFTELNM